MISYLAKWHLVFAMVIQLAAIPAFADGTNGANTGNCFTRFFKSVANAFKAEDRSKSSFVFSDEDLIGVKKFLDTPSPVRITGMSPKLEKFQKLVLKRYGNEAVNPKAIHAFGVLNDFRMVDSGFLAEVKITEEGNTLIVSVPHIHANTAGSLGNVSRGLDVGMARFFANLTKGIEYRLVNAPHINAIKVMPSKVVNRKLKDMLHGFGFVKDSELPDWGEVRGFREGMGPAAEYHMDLSVERSLNR